MDKRTSTPTQTCTSSDQTCWKKRVGMVLVFWQLFRVLATIPINNKKLFKINTVWANQLFTKPPPTVTVAMPVRFSLCMLLTLITAEDSPPETLNNFLNNVSSISHRGKQGELLTVLDFYLFIYLFFSLIWCAVGSWLRPMLTLKLRWIGWVLLSRMHASKKRVITPVMNSPN